MSTFWITMAVAVGGGMGAAGRYWVGVLATSMGAGAHFGTFAVNAIGSALIGIAATHAGHIPHAHAFLVTGLLGGFTTYSAFALETVRLAEAGRFIMAAVYVVSTLVVCLVGALLGVAIGKATA